MKPFAFMVIDTVQFYKSVLTNLFFGGEVNECCHEFIKAQTKLTKSFWI